MQCSLLSAQPQMPACSPASLLTAGSPWEVQFLRDQRGVSDSAEVTSVYYDNPGEGRARWLEQCVRLHCDNYCKRLRIGRRPALLTSFLLPSGRTICSCFASPCGLLCCLLIMPACATNVLPPAAAPPAGTLPSYHTRLRKDDMASVVRLRW